MESASIQPGPPKINRLFYLEKGKSMMSARANVYLPSIQQIFTWCLLCTKHSSGGMGFNTKQMIRD